MMRRFLAGLLLALLPLAAHAACPTLTVAAKDATGATQTFCVGGSAGNFVSQVQVLDSTSANYLAVNGSGQITISNTAFTANAGTNLNTSALALETGGNLAQVVTDLGPPGATACATDTGSCSLNALTQRLAQRLSTINATLGSPFQAGGALAANQSVNLAQVGGSATSTAASGTLKVGIVGSAGAVLDGTAGSPSAGVVTIQGTASGTAVPVSQSIPPNDVVAGPTAFTSPGTLAVNSQGAGSVGIQATGSGAGLAFSFQATIDNTNWFAINAFTQAGAVVTTGSANGNWVIPASGFRQVRVNLTAISSGTETFTVNASAGSVQHPITSQGVAANIQGWGGTATSLGQKTMSASVPVVVASDQSNINVNLAPTTSGGLIVYHVIAAASDNHANIKNGAGQVYGLDAVAAGTGIQYVRLYNAGTGFNGCNSATNLIWGQQVPAAATASGVGAGYAVAFDNGIAFSTGISICISGAVSDTDTTNAATTTVVNVHYK